MGAMYDAEIINYLSIIAGKDKRVKVLKETVSKALKMMQHPRLMKFINREMNFDRFEYTWEQKLDMAKREINLSKKEEKEVQDVGIVLCPKTLKEFYTYIRSAENELNEADKTAEMSSLRKRNVNLEGKRLMIEKEAKRGKQYPLGIKTKNHVERLNRTNMEEVATQKTDMYDHRTYPIVGGKSAQIQVNIKKKKASVDIG